MIATTLAMQSSAMPSIRTARRPKRSESGPMMNWPAPKPIRNVDRIACGRLAIVMLNAEAIFGSAGSIMSIASGFRAMIEAMATTNSWNPIGRWLDETQVSALISVTLRTSLETQSYRSCCSAATHVPGWLLRCGKTRIIQVHGELKSTPSTGLAAVHRNVHRIERRRSANEQAVELGATEGHIRDHFRNQDLSDQRAIGVIAMDTVS